MEESFLETRCLGRGTSLVGNDDKRMCVFGGKADQGRREEGEGSSEMMMDLCLPVLCLWSVQAGAGLYQYNSVRDGHICPWVLPEALSSFSPSRAVFGPLPHRT